MSDQFQSQNGLNLIGMLNNPAVKHWFYFLLIGVEPVIVK